MNTKLELSFFILSNIFHYFIVQNIDLDTLKHYIITLFLFISINFLLGSKELANAKTIHFENVILYNKLTRLEEQFKNLNQQKEDEIKSLKNKFLFKLKNYQINIKRCITPFCDKISKNICIDHLKYKESNCPICYDSFNDEDYPLKCGHFIHKRCISTLKCCPICRSNDLDYLS